MWLHLGSTQLTLPHLKILPLITSAETTPPAPGNFFCHSQKFFFIAGILEEHFLPTALVLAHIAIFPST